MDIVELEEDERKMFWKVVLFEREGCGKWRV